MSEVTQKIRVVTQMKILIRNFILNITTSFYGKLIFLVCLVVFGEYLLKQFGLFELISWELIFGLLIGCVFFNYKRSISQNNKRTALSKYFLKDKDLDKEFEGVTNHIVNQLDGTQSISSKNESDSFVKTKTKSTDFDKIIEGLQSNINNLLSNKEGADSAHSVVRPLLSGTPVVFNKNVLYILKNQSFTLKQEEQLAQHVEMIHKLNQDVRIVIIIGNNFKNDVIHISFKDLQSGTAHFDIPLSFMSLN